MVEPAASRRRLRARRPRPIVVVDEAYVEYGGDARARRSSTSCPNLVVLRTLSKAFGFAALRVGYALAAPEIAALLERAPRAGPDRRAGRRGSPRRRCASRGSATSRRRSPSASACARRSSPPGYDVPADGGELRLRRGPTSRSASGSRRRGIVVRAFPDGIRITVRRAAENDVLLRALGAEPGPAPGREATVHPHDDRDGAAASRSTSTARGRSRVETGIGFLDHLLTLLAFHAGFDLELRRRRRSRRRRAPHGRGRPRLARRRALAGARRARGSRALRLGDRADGRGPRHRRGRPRAPPARRDRARLRRRARRRARACRCSPHALERFAMEAGCTVHVEASGADDHHVAEAAFKALGQALRQAVAAGRRRASARRRAPREGRARRLRRRQPARALVRARARGRRAGRDDRPGGRARRAARADRRRRARRERRARGSRATGSTTRSASGSPRAAGRGHLRRDAAPVRGERRGRRGLGLLAGPVRRLRARRVPHMGWNTLAATRPSALLDGLDGADVYFAHSFAVDPPTPTSRSPTVDHDGAIVAAVEHGPLAGVQFHPERSGRAGRPRAREPAAMVKKRVIPCLDVAGGRVVKGVNFVESARDRRPGRARDPLLGARRRRARLPRHHRDARGSRADPRADRARGRRAVDPVHRRRRRHGRRRRARAAAAPAPTRSRSTAPRSTIRRSSPRSRTSSGRRRSSARSTRAAARSSRTPGGRPRGRDAVDWACEAVARGAGEILLTSIDADGTRAGYDLALTRSGRRRRRGAGDRLGRRRGGARISPRRTRSGPRRRCVASIVHERPERLPELKAELKELGWTSELTRTADPGDRPGRDDGSRADARLTPTRRRCAARARRARRGSGAARGRSSGTRARPRATRSPSRRSATTATATRSSTASARPAPRATPAPSRASRRGSGASSPSAQRRGPRARTSRGCSTPGRPRPRRRSARRASRRRSPGSPSRTSGSSRSSPTSGSTATSCSPRAGSSRRGGGRAAGAGTGPD